MSSTVPQPPPGAEPLRFALLDGAPDDITAAAECLLTDIPGAVYTDPAFGRYITLGEGETPVAAVDWPRLGLDLMAGAFLHLPANRRALLLIAASIGAVAAVPVRLGALLRECSGDINLFVGAVLAAAARAE